MAEQLSSRMSKAASAILSSSSQGKFLHGSKETSKRLDLATAENWLIRNELVALYQDAIRDHMTAETLAYPEGLGGPPCLLEALATFFNTYFYPDNAVQPDDIVVTTGASLCLDALLFSICEVGDSVLVTAPYWNGFDIHLVLRSGIKITPVHAASADIGKTPPNRLLESSLVPALTQAYESHAEPSRIKALVLTNPHNPFGRCYPEHVLREAILWCGEKGIHYISDEVYALSDFETSANGMSENGDAYDHASLGNNHLNGVSPVSLPFVSALSIDLEQGDETDSGKKLVSSRPIDGVATAIGGQHKIPPISVIWSTSKDLCSSGLRVGVFVGRRASQQPPSGRSLLTAALSLLTTPHLPTITTTLLTTSLLTSPSLPSLIQLNQARMRENRDTLARCLRRWRVEYVRTTSAPFMFARLGCAVAGNHATSEDHGSKNCCTEDHEKLLVQLLREKAGVLVAAGGSFHLTDEAASVGSTGDNDQEQVRHNANGYENRPGAGWVRITFAVPRSVLMEALDRIATVLDLDKTVLADGDGREVKTNQIIPESPISWTGITVRFAQYIPLRMWKGLGRGRG
ncbi:pyridoxal phosphate-dependent transferase [Jackrogersella minutella]|nr:pyridoxal phosphate-dependent transferase [Jackrogersella minutella]